MSSRWDRFLKLSCHHAELGISVDASGMGFAPEELAAMADKMAAALAQMSELEAGAISNPDEGRMVGHYWLRTPELAPEEEMKEAIRTCWDDVRRLTQSIHDGVLTPPKAERYTDAIIIGIGGSSLGPQLVYDALGVSERGLRLWFVNNTDPDGFERLVAELGERLTSTLAIVISKSGGTKETRNGMLAMTRAFEAKGLDFGAQTIAITQAGSKLDLHCKEKGFAASLPMWDWVGGRTSVMSAVGLLPAALQGIDIPAFLDGASKMDALTRNQDIVANPAALLAASWYLAGDGKGTRSMVMLPYKDRLELMSRYLQQLVMESLGKALDLDGREVHQGLAVYGNKGSTDQHAYVQQLLDGPDDFFVTFIEVLRDAKEPLIEVEPGVTSGDYLSGFLQGTRRALSDRKRRSLTLTVERLDERSLGALVALYERAVGLYAGLINVNAYHQPGVESGKKAAAEVLLLQAKILEQLGDEPATALQLAERVGTDDSYAVLTIVRHLAANGRAQQAGEGGPAQWRFRSAAI